MLLKIEKGAVSVTAESENEAKAIIAFAGDYSMMSVSGDDKKTAYNRPRGVRIEPTKAKTQKVEGGYVFRSKKKKKYIISEASYNARYRDPHNCRMCGLACRGKNGRAKHEHWCKKNRNIINVIDTNSAEHFAQNRVVPVTNFLR